jgi:hypothetical protein
VLILLHCGLFPDAASTSHYVASNDLWIQTFNWKDYEKRRKLQSGQSVLQQRFWSSASRLQVYTSLTCSVSAPSSSMNFKWRYLGLNTRYGRMRRSSGKYWHSDTKHGVCGCIDVSWRGVRLITADMDKGSCVTYMCLNFSVEVVSSQRCFCTSEAVFCLKRHMKPFIVDFS